MMMVRLACEDDADDLARVHVESWRSAYRGLLPDDYLAGLRIERRVELWRRLTAQQGPEQGVFVLEDDATVVGFAHYAPSRDEDVAARTGEVSSIYLLESHWRRGGGSQLLTGTTQALREADYQLATLWVLDGNGRARAFYERHGWAHDGATKVDDRGAFELHELRYAQDL